MIIKHLAVAVTVAAALSLGAETVLNERTQSLAGVWRLCQADDPAVACPVTVPGDIHTALLAAKIIPDPYVGANEYRTLWVGRKNWNYNRSFTVDAALLAAKSVVLRLDEVDTFCTILVNGRVAGRTDNRFRRWDLDVKALLHPGENTIEARFESAEKKSEQLADQRGPDRFHIQNSWAHHIMHVRKPQCHGGWDWGIDLMTAGLLGRVELVATDLARIDYVGCDARFAADDAICEVAVAADVFSPAGGEAPFTVAIGDARTTRTVRLEPGDNHLTATVIVDHPRRWWPAGEGEQNLYPLALSVGSAALERKIGLRTIEVLSAPDAAPYPRTGKQGNPMTFRVNGRDIFAKGVNWIPCDAFESRQTPTRYRNLLESCRAANMNMVRVWGGGQFEHPAFYQTCDELGIMIWHDFMFSCATYPGDERFLDGVRREIRHQVKNLRDYASIALWCGDNECIGAAKWFDRDEKIRKENVQLCAARAKELDALCRECDPTRTFWPSSPCLGPGNYGDGWKDDSSGDMHYWRVWFGDEPFDNYYTVRPRFCSEFGFQSYPSVETSLTYVSPDQLNPTAPDFYYHQKCPNGNKYILRTMMRYFRFPKATKYVHYLSQVQQAMAIQTGVEHFRRTMPRCMGAIYWQLCDNWPVASWSSIEYGGKWKHLQYHARRFYAPQMILVAPAYKDKSTLEVWAVNDADTPLVGTATVENRLFEGGVLATRKLPMDVPARSAKCLGRFPVDSFGTEEERTRRFLAVAADGCPDNDWQFQFYCNSHLGDAHVKAELAERDGKWTVTLSTDKPAFFVWADAYGIRGTFSDDSFTLLPGRPRTLVFTKRPDEKATFADFRKAFSVTHLRESYD